MLLIKVCCVYVDLQACSHNCGTCVCAHARMCGGERERGGGGGREPMSKEKVENNETTIRLVIFSLSDDICSLRNSN